MPTQSNPCGSEIMQGSAPAVTVCGLAMSPGQFNVTCNGPSNGRIYNVTVNPSGSCLMSNPSCEATASGNVELDVSVSPNPTCNVVANTLSGQVHMFAGPGNPEAGSVRLDVSVNVNGRSMSTFRDIPVVCE